MNAIGAAKLFLMARGRDSSHFEEDLSSLTMLLTEFAMSGYRMGLEKALEIHQQEGDFGRKIAKEIECMET